VVAMISGMSSSANGNAAATGTFFVRHIFPLIVRRYPTHPVAATRWALVVAFILSTALGLHTGSIIGFVVKFLPLTMSGLGVTILFGRFWQRATWQGAMAALIITPVVSLIMICGLNVNNPTLPAALAGAAALVTFTLLTPPRRRSFEEIAETMTRERQFVESAEQNASAVIHSQ
jgi:SSS family solute:Na+ symporter